jgi:hypothetical protein
MTRLRLRLLDANADLHRRVSDVIDAGVQNDVAIRIDRPPEHDAIDGCGDRARFGHELPDVAKRRFLRKFVKHFEEKPEPKVRLQRLVEDHESPPQFAVGRERKGAIDGGLIRANHGACYRLADSSRYLPCVNIEPSVADETEESETELAGQVDGER